MKQEESKRKARVKQEESKSEARGRSRHENNAIVRNPEDMNVVTRGKCPKQGLTSAKDLTIEHPEGRQSPYNRLD